MIRQAPFVPQNVPPLARVDPRDLDDGSELGPAPRQIRLTREVVDRFGPTPTCIKCRAMMRGDPTYSQYPHSQICRRRLEESMDADEAFSQQLRANDRKRAKFMHDYMERSTGKRSAAEAHLEPRVRGGKRSRLAMILKILPVFRKVVRQRRVEPLTSCRPLKVLLGGRSGRAM